MFSLTNPVFSCTSYSTVCHQLTCRLSKSPARSRRSRRAESSDSLLRILLLLASLSAERRVPSSVDLPRRMEPLSRSFLVSWFVISLCMRRASLRASVGAVNVCYYLLYLSHYVAGALKICQKRARM
jgi:hypothetical protein